MLFETPHLRLFTHYRVATLAVRLRDQRSALADIDSALRLIDGRRLTDVLVLRGLDGGFGVEFDGRADPETAELGQAVAERLSRLAPITVAWIDGPCLGGALELALACAWRAAAGGAKTRLGFPQVTDGAVPCWGGTVRLPRLVGLTSALPLLLGNRKLSAAQALSAGLIDRAFGPRMARVRFEHWLLELQRRSHRRVRRTDWMGRLPFAYERQLRDGAARMQASASGDNRSAQATLRAVAAGMRGGPMEGLAAERSAARDVTVQRFEWTAIDRRATAGQIPFDTIGIVGCGAIGSSIAQWIASHDGRVVVRDLNPDAARERLERQFQSAVAKRLMTEDDAARRLATIACTDSWEGFIAADLVIEATDESQSRKRLVLHDLERIVRPVTVIATTSTILPIGTLHGALANPERFLGMHFAHPASSARCAELTAGPQTDPNVVSRVRAWLRQGGKAAVQTADRPGRVLGRTWLPYFHEAVLLATEGVRIEQIDAGIERFGMAWGPFRALDEIGLDVARASLRGMKAAYGPEMSPPALLKRATRSGWLGRKSGAGFYHYASGAPAVHVEALPPPARAVPQDGVNRLVARFVNAAFAAWGEQMADDATIDGIVTASGWPAFRGGPIQYARSRGLSRVVRQLERLSRIHGERLAPCPQLLRLVDRPGRMAA